MSLERYKKFLDLIAIKGKKMLVPTIDIDLAWHAHQCHPSDYFTYTTQFTKRMLDHDDTIGSGDLKKGYASTFILWSQQFNEPYSSILPEFKHWQSGRNVASLLCPPIGVYRILKWRKHVTIYSNEVVPYAELMSGESSKKASFSVIGTPVQDPRARPQRDNNFSKGDSSGFFAVGSFWLQWWWWGL